MLHLFCDDNVPVTFQGYSTYYIVCQVSLLFQVSHLHVGVLEGLVVVFLDPSAIYWYSSQISL